MTAPITNTLIDSFGRKHSYLRISVTDRCNLRCTYCMPQEGLVWKKKQELTTFEEIQRLAEIFVSMGINKIRLTGGEPMVRRDLLDLVQKLGSIEGLETLAMTTNATLLAPNAEQLRRSGMTHLNISLDTFKSERFSQITRQDESLFHVVMDGINAALAQDFKSVKINMVVMAGVNCDEIMDFADFAFKHPVNVRFIEYMPFKDNQWTNEKVVTYKEMLGTIESRYSLRKMEDDPSAVGKDYAIEGGRGSVSFISSMSDSFCGTCNRLRLTADGSIKSCLFYPAETNLRDAMRQGATDAQLQGMILNSLKMKPEAHPPAEEIAAQDNRAMIQIGG
ncbi:MAG: GTP 3',8-cyclase MoaA [Cyanobacteria bacterium SZAS LIN-3]|nr:GTP 3',8-cyclase MoaA [Cyanobacteria bacterium SZAS LIN-3]